MSLVGFFANLCKLREEPIKRKIRTIKDLDYFDTVWIQDQNVIYEGWVFDITRRCIVVCYGPDLLDYRFHIEKPYDRTEIIEGGKILYCNDPNKVKAIID